MPGSLSRQVSSPSERDAGPIAAPNPRAPAAGGRGVQRTAASYGNAAAVQLLREETEQPPAQKGAPDKDPAEVQRAVRDGLSGGGGALPFLERIQASFGRHDVSGIQALQGAGAAQAGQDLGAAGFASGERIALAGPPDLHTAAHEAAHVVQQRGGLSLPSGMGQAGDEHERHADAVADLVVQGRSAEALLDEYAAPGASQAGSGGVQFRYYARREDAVAAVDVHVSPKRCFVWNDGPVDRTTGQRQWRPIPGTGCAHWVAHELGIQASPGCDEGFAIRVSQVTAGRQQVALAQAQAGDIWTNAGATHTGLVRGVTRQGEQTTLDVEHCSSGQGGVVHSNFTSGVIYR